MKVSMGPVRLIKQRLVAAEICKKGYADHRVHNVAFTLGKWVLLKVSLMNCVMIFWKKRGLVWYLLVFLYFLSRMEMWHRLSLPLYLSGVHPIFCFSIIKRYNPNGSHMIWWDPVELGHYLSYEKKPITV